MHAKRKTAYMRKTARALALPGLLALTALGAWWTMIRMPGDSFDGPWEPLTSEEETLMENVVRDVRVLAWEIGDRNVLAYENYLKAADYIEDQLQAASYEVRRQSFEAERRTCYNLEAELRGISDPGRILVIGAHYDSVFGTPAANDNASGVAALLAIARAMADDEPDITVRFVAFANEEPPYFQTEYMGSLVYARAARERGDDIIGMVSLETIGYYSDEPGSQRYPSLFRLLYPGEGNFIGFVGNVGSRHFLRRGIAAFRAHALMPSEGASIPAFIEGVGWSDHWAFWQAGYPGFMVTDTAPFRYPYYHTTEDTPDKLDYPRMTRVVDGLIAMTREMAGVEESR